MVEPSIFEDGLKGEKQKTNPYAVWIVGFAIMMFRSVLASAQVFARIMVRGAYLCDAPGLQIKYYSFRDGAYIRQHYATRTAPAAFCPPVHRRYVTGTHRAGICDFRSCTVYLWPTTV